VKEAGPGEAGTSEEGRSTSVLARFVPRPSFLVPLLALIVITALRIAWIDALPDQGYFAKYTIFADRILAGQIPRDRLADLSPGYLWLVTGLRALGLGFHAMRTLQIALVSLAALCAAMAARRWGWVAMGGAAAFVLGSRGALVCATELEPETLILLFNAAALAALLGHGRPALAGLRLGFSAICRPVGLLFAAVLAGIERSWRLIAAAAVPVVAMILINVVLTGEAVLMDPGTVFYEGMNPSAAGYEGVQPRLVNDLERTTNEPDYLHVAYRLVASRSEGRPLTRAESNRFWTGKALAFAGAYPGAALRLVLRKAGFALQSHEAYDLATMARKDAQLARIPIFVPFGVLVALAGAAVLFRVRGIAPLVGFALAGFAVLIAFYVTARQRNAILPAMAILAAIGLAEIVKRRHVAAAIAVLVVAILLSIDGRWQRDDRAGWSGLRDDFDRALALQAEGKWEDSDRILAGLAEAPNRENRAVPSIAYYRARAAAHLGRDPRPFLERAEKEAPGNEHVLAVEARGGDEGARRRLEAIHDKTTTQRVLATE
jgi:hypothetical protein